MKNFVLFCKSYSGDLNRFLRLWETVRLHNVDKIPFYVAVPKSDLSLFSATLNNKECYLHWLTDEDIILSNPNANLNFYQNWDGRLSQQVVKSEVWRLLSKHGYDEPIYLCLDSESVFTRNFYYSDFLVQEGVPYTVIHENKDLLQIAKNKNINKIYKNFIYECTQMKKIFSRQGVNYDFGPTPVIWSSKVWRDLDHNYLLPKGITLWEAINDFPSELRWYGESLLKYKSIPIYPREPLFRVYHYDWQYQAMRKNKEYTDNLIYEYLGYLKQSNWEFQMDFGDYAKRKPFFSRLWRLIKKFIARYR